MTLQLDLRVSVERNCIPLVEHWSRQGLDATREILDVEWLDLESKHLRDSVASWEVLS